MKRLNDSRGFGFLFEMGCGKTFSSVATAGRLYLDGHIKRLLVVAPTSVVPVWPKEFDEYADFEYTAKELVGSSQDKLKALTAVSKGKGLQVAVINYESTWRIIDELAEWAPEMIICDESQRIKNHAAKQSKALHTIGKRATYKLILSGTPVQNAPMDFFSQYKFLNPDIFGGSYYAFRSRYAIMGGYGGHQVLGYRGLDELTKKAHSIAYRVTKEEALDLPEVIDVNRYPELEDKALKTYNEIKKEAFAELDRGEVSVTNVLVKLLRLSQITGGFITDDAGKVTQISNAKLGELDEIIQDVVVDGKQKLVVFARFIPEIDAIKARLEEREIKYAYITGEVKNRGEMVDTFQTDPKCMVFVAQIQTAGLGITLHAASTAVFYSLDFNLANYLQAKARIHRIGQKNNCTYIHLVAPGTVDEKIMAALSQKEEVAKIVVDNWREILG